MTDVDIAIVGGGIGGLTLALCLNRLGVKCDIFEAADSIQPIGLGINILPHASKVLDSLGLTTSLEKVAVRTREARSYNRFGQLIHSEPLGRFAGYKHSQFSIHRGDLQTVLLNAVEERVGPVNLGRKCVEVEQRPEEVRLTFDSKSDGNTQDKLSVTAKIVIACDGIHSVIRKQLHPEEGSPRYSGVNMWRGVTVWPPVLTGASIIRAGWLATGKLLVYPIRNLSESGDLQLINWVTEFETPKHRSEREWNLAGRLEDFIDTFREWTFDWLDVPEFLSSAEIILESPMVDQPPLSTWGKDRITLLGDAAHPMVPRGSNGAGQAILDAECLSRHLVESSGSTTALRKYESERIPATAAVVSANLTSSPDSLLREVYLRTGDKPFERIEDVISSEEIRAISKNYQQIAGFSLEQLEEAL